MCSEENLKEVNKTRHLRLLSSFFWRPRMLGKQPLPSISSRVPWLKSISFFRSRYAVCITSFVKNMPPKVLNQLLALCLCGFIWVEGAPAPSLPAVEVLIEELQLDDHDLHLQIRQDAGDTPAPDYDLSSISKLAAIGDSYSAGIGAGDRLGSILGALDSQSGKCTYAKPQRHGLICLLHFADRHHRLVLQPI